MPRLITVRCALMVVCAGVCAACSSPTASQSQYALSAALSPPAGAITRCNSVQMTFTLTDLTGAVVASDSVHWSSSDPATAPISATGLVHALAASSGVTIQGVAYARHSSYTAQQVFSISSTGSSTAPCP